MPKITNESNIEEKLKYLGLNLEKVPKFLKENKSLEYRPLKAYKENTYKVYKYIQVSKIQILLTPMNRLNTLKEKYENAGYLGQYLDPEKEEDIIKHTTFLKMLKQVQISEIERIENEQKKLNKQIPFKVKFDENYLWQIYYSDIADKYFTLVPTEDLEYATFFYLLKKQIEYHKTKKEETIFVPICYENYGEEYLKQSEIADLEKYIWFFTKNWSNIYEVYDKDNNLSIVIVGDTVVYDDIISPYKNSLKSKEDAIKFYKLLKALFILQTELPHHYQFLVKLNRYGALEFEYNQKKINYDNLLDVLNREYINAKKDIVNLQEKEKRLSLELKKLNDVANKKDQEYLIKERQIATYLECRKTFFGRVKYFFKSRKKKKNLDEDVVLEEDKKIEEKENNEEKIDFVNKENYTIEDIVKIHKQINEIMIKVQNLELDIAAINSKIERMEIKIKNANLYIEEIDMHEKNIFEFWKFTNKDDGLLLNEAIEVTKENKKIDKVYNYQDDIEEIGQIVDKFQRKLFNKQDLDSIYLLTTNVFETMKNIEDDDIVNQSLQTLQQEVERITFNKEKVDIFGNMLEDHTKIKILGKNKHRESIKDKQKILEINKSTTLEEYKENLKKKIENIKDCIEISKSPISIPVYIVSTEKNELTGLQIFSINPEEIIGEYLECKEIYLYKLYIKEGDKAIYFPNSVYYDNDNKTLPLGMDIGTKGVINIDDYNIKQMNKEEFRICDMVNEFKVAVKKVYVSELEILEEEHD